VRGIAGGFLFLPEVLNCKCYINANGIVIHFLGEGPGTACLLLYNAIAGCKNYNTGMRTDKTKHLVEWFRYLQVTWHVQLHMQSFV
jgi:hypothetical protein